MGGAPEVQQQAPDIQTILANMTAGGAAGGRATTQYRL
jgi:hypothetical protein